MNFRSSLNFLSSVRLKEKVIFTRNLSLVIKTGMSLPQGLQALALQASSPRLQAIISHIKEDVIKGKEFSEALASYSSIFGDFYINMIKTGEISGTLEKILERLAEYMEKERALRSKIISALIYPIVIVIVMIIVMVIMMIVAVPQLSIVFKEFNTQLPFTTRVVIGISDFFSGHIILVSMLLLGIPLVLWYFLFKTSQGKVLTSYILLHAPIVTPIVRKIETARLARTLHTLISSGMSILTSLSITSEVLPNHFYKQTIIKAQEGVEKGKQINEILKQYPHLYPPLAAELIAVGEETGSLDVILEDLAVFYEGEVDVVTKNLSSIIEPLLMVIIGVAVGFFAVSMLQPIYSLTNSISY